MQTSDERGSAVRRNLAESPWERLRQWIGARLLAAGSRLQGAPRASLTNVDSSGQGYQSRASDNEPRRLAPKADSITEAVGSDQSGNVLRLPLTPEPALVAGEAGRVAYDPINVNATYHNGHLYYPIETLVQTPGVDADGEPVVHENTEVVVVRSDRTVHRAHASRPAENASARQSVYRLTDGTLIQRPPVANPHATWSFESIARYVDGAGDDIQLGGLARSVHQHLYSRIWLPLESDYWLLTFIAIASYVQSVFDAVPLCLVVGPGGSGKSELGNAVARISANAVMIGQTSPATMMRLIDESGGLVVIDDLEAIGARGGNKKQERFSEIAQVLKVSYKRSTATKVITDSAQGKTRVLNFFGVKLLNNTTGASGMTLGSRMVQVNTQHLPPEEKEAFLARPKMPESELTELRNLLHTWAMSSVSAVREAYLNTVTDRTMREEEIAAPLRCLAAMAGDKEGIDALEKALDKSESVDLEPVEHLAQAATELAQAGYRAVTLQHVVLELRAQTQGTDEEGADWLKPEWAGRQLRQLGITEGAGTRKRLNGAHLRISTFSDRWLLGIARQHGPLPAERDPLDFCRDCGTCPYGRVFCELALRKEAS